MPRCRARPLMHSLWKQSVTKSRKRKIQARPGLMSVFGKGDKEAVAEVQRIIDEEFSKIDPEDWK